MTNDLIQTKHDPAPRPVDTGRQHDIQEARLDALIEDAHRIFQRGLDRATAEGHSIAGVVVLFSGGNDSTTVAHLFKGRATHAGHANTGIGIEKTRQYVRDTCAAWGLPLLEKRPPEHATYRKLVLGQVISSRGPNKGIRRVYDGGFPGPAMHYAMYQRLKERCIEQMRNELVSNPRRQRVVLIAGRRAAESDRRKHLARKDPVERRGSTVWVSPIVNWTKLDLNAYRRRFPDVPRNEVSDTLHMSGECLCGSFAHPGELDEIGYWFPEMAEEIHALEHEVRALWEAGELPDVKEEALCWGWGAGKQKASKTGPMCDSCSARFIPAEEGAQAA
jgi:3'-phosphoadenosine 5'-phosphosulfate sulfotransferase (PAPS reductase)/FAD synthetase